MQCHVPSHWNAKNRLAKNTGVVKLNLVHISFDEKFSLRIKTVCEEICKNNWAVRKIWNYTNRYKYLENMKIFILCLKILWLFNYLCLKYSKLLVYMDSLFLTMQKTEVLKTRKKENEWKVNIFIRWVIMINGRSGA